MNYKKTNLSIFSFFVFLMMPAAFINALDYIPLEPNAFVGFNPATPSGNSFVDLLSSVYNFGIAAAVVLALVMIIWGGIIKMTTDSWQGQDEAKSKFENAGYGLGLALISYLILYTINPCLVLFTDKSVCNNQFLFTTKTAPVITQTTNSTDSSCPNCVDASFIGCKPGVHCQLESSLVAKLANALDSSTWITEGYPPTVAHQSSCHQNGTCADVNFRNSTKDPATVLQLYNKMIGAGLSVVYEVPKGGDCNPYRNIGVVCESYDTTTGNSFHVK